MAYLNSKFTNALIMYIFFFIVYSLSPFLFLFRFISTIIRRLRPSENMSGKVVLITGASSGIGEYIAYEYAKKGACLVIAARREVRLQKVAQKAREFGSPDVLYVLGDVTKVEDCKRFVDETINHFGRLDHLVTNAGLDNSYKSEMDITTFEPVMEVDFWGSIYPTYFAIPHLKKSKGKIVVNAASTAFFSPPEMGFTSATKAALVGYFESLRAELGSTVKITILALGWFESEMSRRTELNKETYIYEKDVSDIFPIMGTQPCAQYIVNAACRGERYVTEAKFYRVWFLAKFLFPEFADYYLLKSFLPQIRRLVGHQPSDDLAKSD